MFQEVNTKNIYLYSVKKTKKVARQRLEADNLRELHNVRHCTPLSESHLIVVQSEWTPLRSEIKQNCDIEE